MASRSDIEAGRAVVRLFVNDSELLRGLMRAQQRLRNFGQSIRAAGAMFATAGATILAPIGAMVHGFLGAGDALDKMRQRTGISVKALSELQHAANQSGASIEAVEKAVRKMQQEVGAVGEPTKELADSLAFLGVSLNDLRSLSPEQQFDLLAKRIGAVEDPTQRAAMAVAIFGRSGTTMLPMIESMDKLRQEARDMGLTMSDEAAANAVKLGDQLSNLWTTVRFMGHSLAATLAEPLMEIATRMQRAITTTLHWTKENSALVIVAAKAGLILLGIGSAVTAVGLSFTIASTAIGGIATAISVMRGAVTLGIGSLTLLKGAALSMSGVVTTAMAAAKGAWTLQLGAMATGSTFITTLLGGIGTAVGSVVAAINLPVVAAVAAVAALSVVFWRLADPISALMPLVTAVMTSFKNIAGPLLQGDFAGAFEAMAGSIRTIMFAAARGVIDIFRNMLTNLVGLVTGTSGGIVGGLSVISAAAKRIFNEVWESGKVALGALALFAQDVFQQAPQIIGYAFGLAIKQVALAVMKLQDWMGKVFVGFVNALFSSFANMGPSLIRAMLTGDIAGAMKAVGPAVQKALAAQTLAASGLAAGLFGGEMPEFKMSPETIAAYEKMAASVSPDIAGPEKQKEAASPTGLPAESGPAPEKPTLPVSELESYKARLKELQDAYAASTITADEFAAGLADLKTTTLGIDSQTANYQSRLALLNQALSDGTITAEEFATGLSALKTDALKIDATPLEQYNSRLELLNQALADGTITQREWRSAVSDARDEIFGLASSPLDEFRDRVLMLQQALQSGAIGTKEYGEQLAIAKREILGIETSNLDQFGERIKELREQLQAGAITKAEFDNAFKTSQQNFLGIDTDPIDQFKQKLAELRDALDKGLITKEQFKTAAMDALPSKVKSIIDETRTPLEKYKADMAELDKLKGAGLLDDETYKRKQKQLAETRDGQSTASSKPTTFGSFSASALIDSGRSGASANPQDRMAKLLEQNKSLAKDQVDELKELRKMLDRIAAGLVMS